MSCTRNDIGFKGPAGWKGTPKVMSLPRRFSNPTDPKQFIVVAYPSAARPSHPAAGENWTPIRICGDHAAMLMRKHGTIDNEDVQMDGVDTMWDHTRAMAMYARPFGTPADPAAEKAIRSLCKEQ